MVRCPDLLVDGELGREQRASQRVQAAAEDFSPSAELVRPGIVAVPTRGPARYFGGDAALARQVAAAVAAVAGADGTAGRAEVGVADGLFAAVLAARAAGPAGAPVVIPPAGSAAFLAPWPVDTLERPELADLLHRLGIGELERFAALPARQVLARFGNDGAACHRVARAEDGELPGWRQVRRDPAGIPPRPATRRGADTGTRLTRAARQFGFWGEAAAAEARAGQAITAVQQLLGPEAAMLGRLQGGRGPAERIRLVPCPAATGPATISNSAATPGSAPGPAAGSPWPGQVPSPAPALVFVPPRPAQLQGTGNRPVGVSAAGLATTAPGRLSVEAGPWTAVVAWAGPWPSDERWWSPRGRRRRARMQVVTAAGRAYLLVVERGGWAVEGVYD